MDENRFSIECFKSPYLDVDPDIIVTDQPFTAKLGLRGHDSLAEPAIGRISVTLPPMVQIDSTAMECPGDGCTLDSANNRILWTGPMVGDADVVIKFRGVIPSRAIAEDAPYLVTEVQLFDGVTNKELEWKTPVIIKYAEPLTVSPGSDVIYTTVIPAGKGLTGAGTANFYDKFPNFDLLDHLVFDGSVSIPAGSAPAQINRISGVIHWSGPIDASSFVRIKYALQIPIDLPIAYCGSQLSAGGQVNDGVDATGDLNITVTIACPPTN